MSDIDNWSLFCSEKIAELKTTHQQIHDDQSDREYAELCACANINNY